MPALGFPESSYRSHLVDFERTISSGEARYRLAGRIESGGSRSSVVQAKFDRDRLAIYHATPDISCWSDGDAASNRSCYNADIRRLSRAERNSRFARHRHSASARVHPNDRRARHDSLRTCRISNSDFAHDCTDNLDQRRRQISCHFRYLYRDPGRRLHRLRRRRLPRTKQI